MPAERGPSACCCCPSAGDHFERCRAQPDVALLEVEREESRHAGRHALFCVLLLGSLVGEAVIAAASHGVTAPASAPIVTLTAASFMHTAHCASESLARARAAGAELRRREAAHIRVSYDDPTFAMVDEGGARCGRGGADVLLSAPGSDHEMGSML